jgi:hypothetical protein
MAPPENELAASVGPTVLLGRSDDAAVAITQLEAFSTGFRFTLAVRLRQVPPRLRGGGLITLISYGFHPSMEISFEDFLLLGIEYADGRRASTLFDMPGSDPAEASGEQLMLLPQGGGTGDNSADHTFWVSPLPPDGPVTVVLSWPGFGLPESRTVLDGAAFRAAAGRSQVLWPPQPAPDFSPPSPLPRPSSGWFAEPPPD